MRGGKRPNAGRKEGVKIKPETLVYYRRVTPEEFKKLDDFLKKLRENKH